MSDQEKARAVVCALSGNVLAELEYDTRLPFCELKHSALSMIRPGAREDATLALFLDGVEASDNLTLADMGYTNVEEVTFTALIYDPYALALMEINALHREAVERSKFEAAAARATAQKRRQGRLAERAQQVRSEYESQREQPQGPMLMLANEPANVVPTSACLEQDNPQLHDVAVAGTSETESTVASQDYPSDASATQASSQCSMADFNMMDLRTPADSLGWHDEQQMIVSSYECFFDHISFRKGWRKVPFTLCEVHDDFVAAAQVVARARLEILNVRNTGLKIRQVEGSARDWLHTSESAQLLRTDKCLFQERLVHETFKDAHGYVEGLDEHQVDSIIVAYKER